MAIDRSGIRETKTGWQVYVRVRPLDPVARRFPKGTPLRVLVEERDQIKAALRKRRNDEARLAPTAGTFRADAEQYLRTVAAMATIVDRTWQIQQWVDRFGPRRRRDITAAEIRETLADWHRLGYAARTLNHFRTALMHLWHTLDGRSGANPVRDVPSFATPDDLPRDIPVEAATAILGAIRPSKARAVLRLMAATGMTPTEIARIDPSDVRADALVARGRRKGKGTRPRALPITDAVRAALEEFRAAHAWGGVSLKTVGAAWRLAKKKAGYGAMDWTAYCLRHSYLTGMAAGGDDRVVQYLGGHSTPKMTHRYTLGSVPDRVAAVVATVVAKSDHSDARLGTNGRKSGAHDHGSQRTETGENAKDSPIQAGETTPP